MIINAHNANEAYVQSKKLLKDSSIDSSPRGLKIKERLGVSIKILNPRDRIITEQNRNFPLKGALAEFLWYMTENPSISLITPYLKHWERYSDNGETVNSNYGFQWKNQINSVIEKIKRDPDTRQAVVNLYHDDYSSYYGKDNVCTPSFQFLLRDDLLYLIVNARSRDLVRGECIDQFTFTLLQELVANELGVDVGFYQVNIGSLHVYEEHFSLLESSDTFDSSNKEISPSKTYLRTSTFWRVLNENLFSDLIEEDFIRFWIQEKNIDINSLYQGFKRNIYFPKISPLWKQEIF
jgi:thymidylate synthase